jgi:hypothetical protein
VVAIIIDNPDQTKAEYGANNPEPQAYKDSAVTRNEAYDVLDTALEYINGPANTQNPDIS